MKPSLWFGPPYVHPRSYTCMQKVVKKGVDFAIRIGKAVAHFVETEWEQLLKGLDWLWTKIKV